MPTFFTYLVFYCIFHLLYLSLTSNKRLAFTAIALKIGKDSSTIQDWELVSQLPIKLQLQACKTRKNH